MNDERPIEKLLRRYAQQRRDEAGAPPELHPATRRLLQGEVARQFPRLAREARPGPRGFVALLARRWLYAVGMFVVLGLAAALLLPSMTKLKHQTLLAQKTASAEREIVARDTPTLTVAPLTSPNTPQPILTSGERRVATSQPVSSDGGRKSVDEADALHTALASEAATAAADQPSLAKSDVKGLGAAAESRQVTARSLPVSAVPATPTLSYQSPARAAGVAAPANEPALAQSARTKRSDYENAADGYGGNLQAAPPPAPLAVAPAANAIRSDQQTATREGGVEKDAARYYLQSFANVAQKIVPTRATKAKAKAESPIVPVLTHFQVQSAGDEVRVIDSDGSIYRGVLNAGALSQISGGRDKEPVLHYQSTSSNRAQSLADGRPGASQVTQGYLWRAEGTNRTLNQNVVFTWNFVETTNNTASSRLQTTSGALNQDASKLPSQFPASLNNTIINGRAQLGPSQQIEVKAVPVKP